MNRTITRLGLSAALAVSFIGCEAGTDGLAIDRSEQKKTLWRQKRVQAEERFAEIAERLPLAQRERLHEELRREFDEGERDLGSSLR
jgi:hypothetical protein